MPRKPNTHCRRVLPILCIPLLAIGIVILAEIKTEPLAYTAPDYAPIDLLPILRKTNYTDEDYHTLYLQTGLGRPAIEALRSEKDYVSRMLSFQKNFFTPIQYSCERRLIVTCQEFLTDENGRYVNAYDLAPLEDGDILITKSSHTFGWRNGHAGIVTNAKAGRTVEAVSLGTPSCIQSTEDWRGYPTLIILRLRDDLPEETDYEGNPLSIPGLAGRIAEDYLVGLPYHLTIGVFESKYRPPSDLRHWNGTQCAHLVWLAYRAAGLDLDSDGGRIVTVYDLVHSPYLEIVQVFGVDPENPWP